MHAHGVFKDDLREEICFWEWLSSVSQMASSPRQKELGTRPSSFPSPYPFLWLRSPGSPPSQTGAGFCVPSTGPSLSIHSSFMWMSPCSSFLPRYAGFLAILIFPWSQGRVTTLNFSAEPQDAFVSPPSLQGRPFLAVPPETIFAWISISGEVCGFIHKCLQTA